MSIFKTASTAEDYIAQNGSWQNFQMFVPGYIFVRFVLASVHVRLQLYGRHRPVKTHSPEVYCWPVDDKELFKSPSGGINSVCTNMLTIYQSGSFCPWVFPRQG